MTKKCVDCDKRPSFNFEDEYIGIYCISHKKEGMINVNTRKCLLCNKKPAFNYVNIKPAIYCTDHKLEEMINVYAKKCQFEGCDLEVINRNGSSGVLPKFCEKHKNKLSGICKFGNCTKSATSNFINEKTGIYCAEHKLEGMICVANKRCNYNDCIKSATHNFLGEKELIYCSEHSEKGMINIKNKKCEYEGCNIMPCFGFENSKSTHCNEHKVEGMICLKGKKCEYEDCKIRPTFNFEGLKERFCATHKLEGMINVKDKKCIFEGCKTTPVFNYENESKPLYCSSHKLEGMVDIFGKKCQYEDCKTKPSYNFEGSKPIYCSKHKLEGMIDVINRKCEYENCKVIPNFNYINEKLGRFCSKHKLEGMVDIKHKKCIFENCNTQPVYNYEDENVGLYCIEHKLDEMVDVKYKKCKYEGCKSRSNYNFDGLKSEFCAEHKLEGMINVSSKKCQNEKCLKYPNFNFLSEKSGIYCSEHKLEGMISIFGKCEVSDCIKKATFNFEELPPKFCVDHISHGMVNVRHKKCLTPLCNTVINNTVKYEGYCLRCFIYTFPDKPVTKNYKTKEKYVSDFVKSKITNVDWITDKKIMDGCSKRRPDLLLDMGDQVIIVEIDENQHEYYDCSCENKRVAELSQDLNHRPLVIIRFNPDEYIDIKGNNIPSCWKVNKLGICSVNNVKKLETRLNFLTDTINYWIKNKTNKTIEIIKLFYDEN